MRSDYSVFLDVPGFRKTQRIRKRPRNTVPEKTTNTAGCSSVSVLISLCVTLYSSTAFGNRKTKPARISSIENILPALTRLHLSFRTHRFFNTYADNPRKAASDRYDSGTLRKRPLDKNGGAEATYNSCGQNIVTKKNRQSRNNASGFNPQPDQNCSTIIKRSMPAENKQGTRKNPLTVYISGSAQGRINTSIETQSRQEKNTNTTSLPVANPNCLTSAIADLAITSRPKDNIKMLPKATSIVKGARR